LDYYTRVSIGLDPPLMVRYSAKSAWLVCDQSAELLQGLLSYFNTIAALFVEELCHLLKTESIFQKKDRILVVNDMWSCWTMDIIGEYLLEQYYSFTRKTNFKASLVTSLFALLDSVH
jgi:hypothetical protein